jgi:hypothetical protein
VNALRRLAAPVLLVGATSLACAGKTEPAKGQLMIAVQTDMALPKDVDAIRVEVLSYGSVQFANTYQVGAGALLIPATLALIAGEDPARPVTVRVVGLQNQKARMMREAVTTIPQDRIATLRMPIHWLCDESVKEPAAGQYETACAEGQTCDGGRCVASVVDAATLATFDVGDVFGGGDGSGDGACFDTAGCMSRGAFAAVDAATCSLAPPATTKGANVAVATGKGHDGSTVAMLASSRKTGGSTSR